MAKERKIVSYEVDAETGEILGAIYEDDKIVRADKTDEKDKKVFLNTGRKFVKFYDSVLKAKGKGDDKLTDKEIAVLTALANFVCYDSCCLREGGHGNGRVLKQADLAKKLEMKYKNFNDTFRSLKKKKALDVLHTGKEKTITINPYLIMRGVRVNATVADYFKDSAWANTENVNNGGVKHY